MNLAFKIFKKDLFGTIRFIPLINRTRLRTVIITALIFIFDTSNAYSEFSADDVLVITNSNMLESIELGHYYAKKRGIPADSVLKLPLSMEESISREEFNKTILFPLKEKIYKHQHLQSKRIYVLMYGVPLAIGNTPLLSDAPLMKSYISHTKNKIKHLYRNNKNKLLKISNSLGIQINIPTEMNEAFDAEQLITQIFSLYSENNSLQSKTSAEINKSLEKIIITLLGSQGKLLLIQKQTSKNQSSKTEMIKNEIKNDLKTASPDSEKSLKLFIDKLKKHFGIVGVYKRLFSLEDELLGKNTGASIDSELSIMWLLPGQIPLTSRIPNPLYKSSKEITFPMPLISRLDAHKPKIVKEIINASIETEKNQALKGSFLIDSRGIPWDQRDEYGSWDRDLTKLARKTKTGDLFSVKFDSRPELASKTENIALYVGWYQVRNYHDVYSFNQGAVGYHIASSEAMSIRSESEKGWCKNLLERGVVSTIGAVNEPYLDSFPLPSEFFNYLLSGKYQLIDAYYLTTKYISWRLILFGDPLYKPVSKSLARDKLGYSKSELQKLPSSPSVFLKSSSDFMKSSFPENN